MQKIIWRTIKVIIYLSRLSSSEYLKLENSFLIVSNDRCRSLSMVNIVMIVRNRLMVISDVRIVQSGEKTFLVIV